MYFIQTIDNFRPFYNNYNYYYYNLNDENIFWRHCRVGYNKMNKLMDDVRKSQYAISIKDYYDNKKLMDLKKYNLKFVGNFEINFCFGIENLRELEKIKDEFSKINEFYGNSIQDNDFDSILYNWKLLKYEEGGKFDEHIDGIKNERHMGTMILLPPKKLSNYKGGELVLFDDDKKIEISNDENKWIFVYIPTNMKHKVNQVLEGTRFSYTKEFIIKEKYYNLMNSIIINDFDVFDENKMKKDFIKNKIDKYEEEIVKIRNNINALKEIKDIDKYEIPSDFFPFNCYQNFIVVFENYIESNKIEDIDYEDYLKIKKFSEVNKDFELKFMNVMAKINIDDNNNYETLDYDELDERIEVYEYNSDEGHINISVNGFKYYNVIYFGKKLPGIAVTNHQEYNDEYYELESNRKVSVVLFKKID